MGLSRRQFTKEFKLAAVRRLEQGVSIGEAARALEVNPNVLHRWRREFREFSVKLRTLRSQCGNPVPIIPWHPFTRLSRQFGSVPL